jgi:flagellar basal-body rod protein FlgC
MDPVFEAVGLDRLRGAPSMQQGVSLVRVSRIQEDARPGAMVYEPSHPDANAQGYVTYPNVNAVEEMVNMITATRAYEAGVTSINSIKQMARSALEIGR